MYTKYYFHIQLSLDSDWIAEIGTSITEVMSNLSTFDTLPYCWFKTDY